MKRKERKEREEESKNKQVNRKDSKEGRKSKHANEQKEKEEERKKTKPLRVVFDLTRVKKFDSLFCFPWKTQKHKKAKNTFYYKFLFDLQNKGQRANLLFFSVLSQKALLT